MNVFHLLDQTEMRMLLVQMALVPLLLEVTAGALPDYPCSASFTKHKSPADDPCQGTTAIAQLVPPCKTFMDGNVTLPSANCCASARNVSLHLPACFCRITFFPLLGDVLKHRAEPLLCNVTADLCRVCPTYLFSHQPEPTNFKEVVALVITTIGVTLALVGCALLLHWRKKIFSKHFEDREFVQHCKDIKNIEGSPTIFPYSVLKSATKNFDPDCKLGEGGFGSVFKGVLPDGMEVAVKKLSAKSQQGNCEFLNEVTLISSVQHRNLVKLRGCCLKGEERLLVYEYLENKSLHQALFNTPVLHLDWGTRMKILEGTARGLAYLHEGSHTRIVHRDIKASNILLDKDLNPKIADFGLARIFSENDTHVSTRIAGTAGYLAPEYAMRGQLTEKADVFSFGIVALELVSGRPNLDVHLQPHAAYLLDLIWQLYEGNKLVDLLDPANTWCNNSIQEATRVIEMALLCTHSRATLRPTMTCVVSILTEGSQVVLPKLGRSDVRDYAPLEFKTSNSANSTPCDSILRFSASHGCESGCSNTDTSIVSALQPR